ncbi:ArsC family reductase [Sodalis ligni]|uniref:ArsC family reductase n=1 Tax=Sodalis ligni TaxID=2697027 RepID=UPI00193EE67D|nr:ArsC family reductase [Sodalis ligni]QWA09646.1 ArsC family reductase [Sodalis ligni]
MHEQDVSLTIYGIKNCDTMKKARRWLDEAQLPYRFHDYRADGVTGELLQGFIRRTDWRVLLNTRGTTWRKLSEEQRRQAEDAAGALALMLSQPAIIKRPVLQRQDGALLVGFDPAEYQKFTGRGV